MGVPGERMTEESYATVSWNQPTNIINSKIPENKIISIKAWLDASHIAQSDKVNLNLNATRDTNNINYKVGAIKSYTR